MSSGNRQTHLWCLAFGYVVNQVRVSAVGGYKNTSAFLLFVQWRLEGVIPSVCLSCTVEQLLCACICMWTCTSYMYTNHSAF